MRTWWIAALCFGLLACDKDAQRTGTPPSPAVQAACDAIERENRLWLASEQHTARRIVASSPHVQTLVAAGEPAAQFVATKFEQPSLPMRDLALAHYAYVIEATSYKQCLPVLNRFLADPRNRRSLDWAIVFAERARKTLEKA